MFKLRYYLGLSAYPIALFLLLGSLQYAILWNAYKQKAYRQSQPYVNGAPLPEPDVSVDRRPQSITIPSLEMGSASARSAKTDRAMPAE